MAKIANVALTNTFDTWRSRSNEAFDRLSQFAINNSSLYANTLTANVLFTAKGRATVGTNLTVSGNTNLGDTIGDYTIISGRASVGTNLTVSGNTTLGAAGQRLTFGGAGAIANVTGWFGVAGRATVSTNLFVGGNTGIGTVPQGALSIKGTITGSPSGGDGVHIGASGGYAVQEMAGTTGGYIDFHKGDGVDYRGRVMYTHALEALSFHTAGRGPASLIIAGSGLVTACNSMTVTNTLTVSGNTTINGTTTDNSNALSQTLTDGATINWNIALGRVATVTLAGNRTMAAPTNLKVGTYIMTIIQDATGSRTMTWNAVFKWTAGVAPPLTTTANAKDVFSFFSDGTNMFGSFMPDVR